MSDEKKEMKKEEDTQVAMETPGIAMDSPISMPTLPKPLTMEEKKYLLAVERGDMGNVRRMLQRAHRKKTMDMNCVDPLGRGAVSISIDAENLEMLELLIVMGVDPKDALLQAIDVEFVEAVELLLEYEELVHRDGDPYSWEKVDWNTGSFSPDITPIILAAHRNNYEIIKILLDRGATLPMPHDVRCGCEVCIRESAQDSLRHSLSRVNQYRALASPSLIALSSNDPILTAFQLSWELRNLALTEQESKNDYLELRRQVQAFAVDLLQQSRSSQELAIVLNHDPNSPPYEDGGRMHLQRLELAIHMKQKKFVAHPNVQQLLAALWYDGLPGFRRKSGLQKLIEVVKVALLFPFYCILYMIAPDSPSGRLMRKPFMKFLIKSSSYLFFLLLLILVSQHAEQYLVLFFGTDEMKRALAEANLKQRGNAPTMLEWAVVLYVIGFIWEEISEMTSGGLQEYLLDMWNVIDFVRNSLYVMVMFLRVVAFVQQTSEISRDPASAYIPREEWADFDPQLISEGLFAAANIFSALKLVHLFSINPHLGPLQISLGRMVIDIIKFFFIYSLVLFAFACGMNQLLGYFAQLERKKCYVLPGGLPDWDNNGDACTKWRRFGNLFESSQSLFWASFGMVGIDSFELTGIKTYTRFWGQLMFGSYCVINIIVLLNLLIAMMSNSFSAIVEHADTEWKFARTRLWMSYFEESSTLPPPFNIFPTVKLMMRLCGMRKKAGLERKSTKRKEKEEKERDYRYTAVIRSLVWRYVCHQHKMADESPVTEDDINEVKGEVSAMKYDILEVLGKNGMDTSSVSAKDKAVLGKKMKIWERQLMKDFHLAPVAADEDMDQLLQNEQENEDPLDRFRRVAKLAVLKSCAYKWSATIDAACQVSKIGRSNNRSSLRNQENLQRAMNEARKLMLHSPIRDAGEFSPIRTPEVIGGTLQNLLSEFKQETKCFGTNRRGATGEGLFLTVNNLRSANVSPASTLKPTTDKRAAPKPGEVPTVCQTVDTRVIKRKAPAPIDPANPIIVLAPPTPQPQRVPVIPAVPASPESYHGDFASTEHLITPHPEGSPRHRIPRNPEPKKKKGGWI